MVHVVLTGVIAEYNFGSPSILHGMEELLKILFGEDYQITDFQKTNVNPACNTDFTFPICQSDRTVRQLLFALLKSKITGETHPLIEAVKQADVVIDLFGICFCDKFDKAKYYPPKAAINAIGKFAPLFVAKSFGVRTAKNTCSFGPMRYPLNSKAAHFASRWLFDVILCREEQSRKALAEDAKVKREIHLSPDVANLMRYQRHETDMPRIGISTSHQIIKQWDSSESYIDCIVKLCQHIDREYHFPIVLIPNEYNPEHSGNDWDVSNEIKGVLKTRGTDVEVLDVFQMNSTEIKNVIASCEVVVASRYHSCVAALSSGVPTLVIGWHYKYDELLEWYGQGEWIISNKDCNSDRLIERFDSFWNQRGESGRIIREQYPKVRKAVVEAGKMIFSW